MKLTRRVITVAMAGSALAAWVVWCWFRPYDATHDVFIRSAVEGLYDENCNRRALAVAEANGQESASGREELAQTLQACQDTRIVTITVYGHFNNRVAHVVFWHPGSPPRQENQRYRLHGGVVSYYASRLEDDN